MAECTSSAVSAAASPVLWFLERLVLGFYWPYDNWGTKRYFPPSSFEDSLFACWTIVMAATVIVAEVWNGLTWQPNDFVDVSPVIAVFVPVFGLITWGLGLLLISGALWLRAKRQSDW